MSNTMYYRSSAEHISIPLDCRRLALSFRYHQLTREQIICMISDFINAISELSGDNYIFEWYQDLISVGRKPNVEILQNAFLANRKLHVSFDAYVSSPLISNLATLKKYRKVLQTVHPIYMYGWNIDPNEEYDALGYQPYIDSKFPLKRPDNQETLSKIYEIFTEPGKKPEGLHWHPDLRGFFIANPYQNNAEAFYGYCTISFSAFCVGDMLEEMSNRLSTLAIHISNTYKHVNAHVSLEPQSKYGCHYMHYFGKHPLFNASHKRANCTEEEWYPVYHLCGVEWLNILSPLASQHIPVLNRIPGESIGIRSQQLEGGGLLIRSAKAIDEYDYSEALALKNVLLPALYPGRSSMPLRALFPFIGASRTYGWCPRHKWEIVPIEQVELSIVGTDLVYTSRSASE